MKKLIFFLITLSHISFSQINFAIKQELEKSTSYGYTTKVYGTDMFISAPYPKDEVKVYRRQSDGTWAFLQTLKPSDKPSSTTSSWYYGSDAIALNDSNAVIGASYKDLYKDDAGAAYFYRKGTDGFWKEETIVENPSMNQPNSYSYYAGKNIAIHQNKATISHNNGYPLFVHIYERKSNGTWVISDTIDAPFPGLSGIKTGFKGNVFTAMAFDWYKQDVIEYTLQPNGNWAKTDQLTLGSKTYNTYFGQYLSIDQNQMAVCASDHHVKYNSDSLPSAGKVFIYEKVNNKWSLKQELTAPVPTQYAYFGRDAVIKGDTLVIASSGEKSPDNTTGAVYIYLKENNSWVLKQKFQTKAGSGIGTNVHFANKQIISFGYSSVFVLEIPVPVTGITVSPTNASITKGTTAQLTVTIAPANATNKNIIWSSSDTDIATVDETGLVTGVSVGSVAITATSGDGNFKATSDITVTLTTGLDAEELSSAICLYPNPASNKVTFSNVEDNVLVIIFNNIGVQVKSETLRSNKELNIADLNPGVYVVRIYNNDTYTTQKLSVIK